MKHLKILFQYMAVFGMILFLLYGCSLKQEKAGEKTEQEADAEELEAEPLPKSYGELAELPEGKYKDLKVSGEEGIQNIKEAFGDLPDISGNPSKKMLDYYYREVLKRVQVKFNGPEKIIEQLKYEAIEGPEMEDSRYQFKENLNVLFIIDASGSMNQKINGKTKMDSAKESILAFVEKLPEDAKVGIRVYGHKGRGSDADQQLSCSSSELVYSISNYNPEQFRSALDKFAPSGWTPIGLALREAKKRYGRV